MRFVNMNLELFYILSYCCICLPKRQDSNLDRKLPTLTELPFTTHILKNVAGIWIRTKNNVLSMGCLKLLLAAFSSRIDLRALPIELYQPYLSAKVASS